MRDLFKVLRRNVWQFSRDRRGNTTMRNALLFAAVGLALAVLGAPMMQDATKYYAENRAFGIDRVLTGSVNKPERYTIRRSVLSPEPEKICEGNRQSC